MQHMDDFWSEIQDMPGEIFDVTELEEDDSKMNIKCDEFSQTDLLSDELPTSTVNVLPH